MSQHSADTPTHSLQLLRREHRFSVAPLLAAVPQYQLHSYLLCARYLAKAVYVTIHISLPIRIQC
jgi:hypothetical protein